MSLVSASTNSLQTLTAITPPPSNLDPTHLHTTLNPTENIMTSLAHKRKRDSLDHDVNHAPPASSDFKDFRASPTGQVDYESPFLHSSHENDMPPHFADALVQHNAGDHGVHDHSMHDHNVHVPGPSNGQSASETANAALHYSMGVPQNHDESFLSHTDPHRESSATFSLETGPGQQGSEAYGEFAGLEQLKENPQPRPQQQQQQAQPQTSVLGTTEGSPSATPSGLKPAVGTDEWHKVRRDNHKEGTTKTFPCCHCFCSLHHLT
jgi:hypothetical protein